MPPILLFPIEQTNIVETNADVAQSLGGLLRAEGGGGSCVGQLGAMG
jgi:hypothetical protein